MSSHRIYHSLGNSSQMFGCDRELFLINILICGALIVLSMDVMVSLGAITLGVVNFIVLLYMGKKDILLRPIYLRQLRYRMYYQAKAAWHTNNFKRYR